LRGTPGFDESLFEETSRYPVHVQQDPVGGGMEDVVVRVAAEPDAEIGSHTVTAFTDFGLRRIWHETWKLLLREGWQDAKPKELDHEDSHKHDMFLIPRRGTFIIMHWHLPFRNRFGTRMPDGQGQRNPFFLR